MSVNNRLAALERAAGLLAKPVDVQSLTDEELEAILAEAPAAERARLEALSDEELEQLIADTETQRRR